MCYSTEPQVQVILALKFSACLAIRLFAINPLVHATQSPSGPQLINALCEEALQWQEHCSEYWVVLERWGVEVLPTCQIAGGDGSSPSFLTFLVSEEKNDNVIVTFGCICPGGGSFNLLIIL